MACGGWCWWNGRRGSRTHARDRVQRSLFTLFFFICWLLVCCVIATSVVVFLCLLLFPCPVPLHKCVGERYSLVSRVKNRRMFFFPSFSPFCLSVSVTSSRRSLTPPFLPTITKQRGSPRLCFLFPSFAASPLPTNKERKKMSAVQLKINIVKLGSVKMIKVRRTLRSTLLTPHAAVVPRRHDRPRSLPRHQGEAW